MLGDAWEGQKAENAITEDGNGKAFQPQGASQLLITVHTCTVISNTVHP